MGDDWLTIGGVGVGSVALTILGGFVSKLWTLIKSRVDAIDKEIEACKIRDATQNERLIKIEARVQYLEGSTAEALTALKEHFDTRFDHVRSALTEIREELRELRKK